MNLELQGATVQYGPKKVLDQVSLRLGPGELVAVMGLNGAGKTTLLNTLAGLIAPSEGKLFIDGEPFRRDNLAMRRRMIFVPDAPVFFDSETVLRNIGIYLRQYERAQVPGMAARVVEFLEGFDLLPQAEAYPDELSRGEFYKAGLCALAAVNPELWLLDEPFASGMDPPGQARFKKLVRDAVDGGSAVIYSTQWAKEAEEFSTRLAVLVEGRIKLFDSATELRTAAETDSHLAKLVSEPKP